MKAVVAAFNQEKALAGALSVIVQLHRFIVYSTSYELCLRSVDGGHATLQLQAESTRVRVRLCWLKSEDDCVPRA